MDWNEICEKKPRKAKSIGYLTSRILAELPDKIENGESWEITVDQVVDKFQATKGTVYEVFHVFEALLLVTKVWKTWNIRVDRTGVY